MLTTWLRRMVLGGLFITPLIPVFVAQGMFFPFITGKNFAFRILVEIVFAVWALLAVRDPHYRPKMSYIMGSLAAFLVVIGLADILGSDPYRSFWSTFERMEGFVGLLHLGAYFVVLVSMFKTEDLWRQFFHTSLGVSLFLSVFGFLQLMGVFAIDQGGVRVDATLGNAIYFAVYLLFHIFFAAIYYLKSDEKGTALLVRNTIIGAHALIFTYALYLTGILNPVASGFTLPVRAMLAWGFLSALVHGLVYVFVENKHLINRLFYGELIVMQLIMLYFTATRGATLGLVGGAILTALVVAYSKEGTPRKVALSLLGGIAALAIIFFAVRNTDFVQNSPVLRRFSSFQEATIQSRAYIWGMSFEGFKEKPILGWGQENYNIVFNKYYDPHLWSQEQWFDRAHNVFLDWLIAGGILGILSYLALFGSAIYVLMHPKRSDFSLYDRALFFGLLMGYFAQNLTVFDNLTSYMFFFVILAYIHVRGDSAKNETVVHRDAWKFSESAQWAAGGVLAVGLVGVLYFVNVKPILASSSLIHAMSEQPGGAEENFSYLKKTFEYETFANAEASEQSLNFAIQVLRVAQLSDTFKQQVAQFSLAQMGTLIQRSPNDARYRFSVGSFLRQVDATADAKAQLEKAVELSPNKQNLIIELGSFYLGQKDYPNALAQMKKAYELDTTYEDAKRIYALAAIYAQDYKLAESLLLPDYKTIAIDDDRFVGAFLAVKDYKNLIALWQGRVDKAPENGRMYAGLGAAYMTAGQRAQAMTAFQKAVQLDPTLKTQIEQQADITLP